MKKKTYFITDCIISNGVLIKCLDCMGVPYDENEGSLFSDDYVTPTTITDIQKEFAYELLLEHDQLDSCYDQEEYDNYLKVTNRMIG